MDSNLLTVRDLQDTVDAQPLLIQNATPQTPSPTKVDVLMHEVLIYWGIMGIE